MTITSTYASFVLDTGPNWATRATARHNGVARLNYATQGFLTRGKKMARTFRGGQYITDQVMLSLTPRAENIGILQSTTPVITETGVNGLAYWRIQRTHIAWDERIRKLNAGGSAGSEGGFQTFKRMRDMDMQEMYTDLHNFIDDNLWRLPNFTEMTTAAGTQPYSIPSLINEHADGLTTALCDGSATLWTSKLGIAGTTTGFSNFAAQRFTYNNMNVASNTNLIAAFDTALFALNFTPPPTNKQYFDDESGMLPSQVFIACSPAGAAKLKQLCRNSQDRWSNPLDAYGGRETYNGVPVVPVSALTTAAIFPTGSSGAAGLDSVTTNSNAGARYYLINSNDIDIFYHDEMFMTPSEVQSEYGNPSRKAIFYETFSNMWARALRTSGIIYPTANIPA